MDRQRTARFASAALVALVAVVAGCATPPPAAPRVETPFTGQVLGRSDRFIVYEPAAEDTLASLASRFLGSPARHWVIADFNDIDHVTAGSPVTIPLAPVNAAGVRTADYQTVTILCYHRFGPGKSKMIVSPTQFAAQLDWLDHNDYRVIPLKQLAGFLAGRENIPRRAVVITIDDGHESGYQYAVPLLHKHGFPATFFIYTDFVGTGSGALTWPQLKEMTASGEFEIGAHSKTHRNLIVRNPGESDVAYRNNIEMEVRVPVDVIGRQLQIPVSSYAYPYGDANDIVLTALGRGKVELATTVTPGGNAFFAQPTLLHRTMIFGEYDLEAFKSKLQTSRRSSEP